MTTITSACLQKKLLKSSFPNWFAENKIYRRTNCHWGEKKFEWTPRTGRSSVRRTLTKWTDDMVGRGEDDACTGRTSRLIGYYGNLSVKPIFSSYRLYRKILSLPDDTMMMVEIKPGSCQKSVVHWVVEVAK